MGMASSHRSSQSVEQRLSRLERQMAALQDQAAVPEGAWERISQRIRRTGDSRSTIERQVRLGHLDHKREGRRAYVRDRPEAPPRRGRGRPPRAKLNRPLASPSLPIANPAGPAWPATALMKEPSSESGDEGRKSVRREVDVFNAASKRKTSSRPVAAERLHRRSEPSQW